jgi:Type II secretion system (T2SS), protein N
MPAKILFAVVLIVTLIYNAPAILLKYAVRSYTHQHLALHNPVGKVWNGSGIVSAVSGDKQRALLSISWEVSLGTKRFISLSILSAQQPIATIDITKDGLQISDIDIDLAINDLAALYPNSATLELAGNLHITATKIAVSSANTTGTIAVDFNNINTSLANVNPLGSYHANITINGSIASIMVNSNKDSILLLNGSGNLQHLTLVATSDNAHRVQLLGLLGTIGRVQIDGSYNINIL